LCHQIVLETSLFYCPPPQRDIYNNSINNNNNKNINNFRKINWQKSVEFYELAVEKMQGADDGDFDATMDTPIYQLQAKMAEMYLAGGNGLEADPNRAGT
jgi:hypothetical protein